MNEAHMFDGGLGFKAIGHDKHGPMFEANDVNLLVAKMINTDVYFTRKAKKMTTDLDRAQFHIDDAMKRFTNSIDNLGKIEELFIGKSKKVTSAVKDSEEKLLQGLARVEKAANFERLNRYVELLERAATAMNQLAELQKDGKLDKIASAIR